MKTRRHSGKVSSLGIIFALPIADVQGVASELNRKNLGILAAYDDPGTRLFTANDGAEFVRQANAFRKTDRLLAFTAKTAMDLPDSDYHRATREALLTIAIAQQHGDKSFLDKAKSILRSPGAKRGRKPDKAAKRRTVEELKRYLEGGSYDAHRDTATAIRSFKSTEIGKRASDLASDPDRVRTKEDRQAIIAAVAFHKQISRGLASKRRSRSNRRYELCWDAFQLWVFFGEPHIDQSLQEAEMDEFERLGFNLPEELDLLEEAIRLGEQQLPSS